MLFSKVTYNELNARQQESYNFHKLSAVLADYGFTSIRLSDDWESADLIAVHIDGTTSLKIQLKGRLSFAKKYLGKQLYIAFPNKGTWYLYPHDEVQKAVFSAKSYGSSRSWKVGGGYSVGRLGGELQQLLAPYRL